MIIKESKEKNAKLMDHNSLAMGVFTTCNLYHRVFFILKKNLFLFYFHLSF